MRNTLAIAFKEFKSYLASPMAYIVIGIFLVFTGFFFGWFPPTSMSTYMETSIKGFLQPSGIMLLLSLMTVIMY